MSEDNNINSNNEMLNHDLKGIFFLFIRHEVT